MTMTRKGWRTITVDGVEYRWRISPEATSITVLIVTPPGVNQHIEVTVPTDINRFWVEFPHVDDLHLRVVKPADVRLMIQQARALGWRPEEKGPPIIFQWGEEGKFNRR